jgi:hypothetical protein
VNKLVRAALRGAGFGFVAGAVCAGLIEAFIGLPTTDLLIKKGPLGTLLSMCLYGILVSIPAAILFALLAAGKRSG